MPRWSLASVALFVALLQLPAARGVAARQADDPCHEPYDDPVHACTLHSRDATAGYLRQSDTANVYRFVLPPGGGRVQIVLSDLPADYDLFVFGPDQHAVPLAASETAVSQSIDADLELAGEYSVYVHADIARAVDPDRPYRLSLLVTPHPAPPPPVPTATPLTTVTALPTVTPAPAPSAPVTLSVSPTDVAWVRPITVTWANIPNPSAEAWFQLFRVDDVPGAHSTAMNVPESYVSCLGTPVAPQASGSCTIPDLVPSNIVDTREHSALYQYRLFADLSSQVPLAVSNPIRLRFEADATTSGARVSVSPPSVTTSGALTTLTVVWSDIPDASASAWFGVFRPEDPLAQSTVNGVPFGFVSCVGVPVAPRPSGSCTMDIWGPILDGPRTSETFEVRLFSDRDNNTLLARSSFTDTAKPDN